MGNRQIHIHSHHGRLSHVICRQKLSEMEIFQLFIKPASFRNRIDFHLRLAEEPLEVENPHWQCIPCWSTCIRDMLDLRLLATSSEIREQATKLMYQTNTFSFETLPVLNRWLPMVPPHLLACVQHLNIEMPFSHGTITNDRFDWALFFPKDINAKLPHIKSLNLAVLLDGLVTCWRNTFLRDVCTDTFRPLRQLKHLRTFTIVINEHKERNPGYHVFCEDQTHDRNPRYTFWARKEIRRVWAEEIREMVLGG